MRPLVLLLVFGCTTKIADVDPTQFACTSDEALADGTLPCPDSHWCDEGVCRARLLCTEDGATEPGCNTGDQRRCEPQVNTFTSAVKCAGGNNTITSTVPRDDMCTCPDQGAGTKLFCAIMAEGIGGQYPLFLVPSGSAIPTGQLGITGDQTEWRRCVRACATELDCPGSHTCRPAPVVSPQMLTSPSNRHTVGACYPNRLVGTSTITPIDQPDVTSCLTDAHCDGDCQYQAKRVDDHAAFPVGDTWDGRALIGQCIQGSGGLRDVGGGCTVGPECRSGICQGTCQQPCDPNPSREDDSCRVCIASRVQRTIPGSDVVVLDRVHICER